jgi:hypothetical protein
MQASGIAGAYGIASEFRDVFGYVIPLETMPEILCGEMPCRLGDDHNVSHLRSHNKVWILLTYMTIHIRFQQL